MTNKENEKLQVLTDEELVQVAGGVKDGDVMYDVKCTVCGTIIGGGGWDTFTPEKQQEKYNAYNMKGCLGCGAKNSMKKITGYWSDDALRIIWNS